MKKSKLNLNDLKVESFVTDLNANEVNTVKGGNPGTDGSTACGSDPLHCATNNTCNPETIFIFYCQDR